MERYLLKTIYPELNDLKTQLTSHLSTSALVMGLSGTAYTDLVGFITSCIYGYFYDDIVAYEGEDTEEVSDIFETRISYDISVRLPYWYKKYLTIKKLLTTDDLSLLQTSKMTSSSTEDVKSAGGVVQKTASTPTGVSQSTDTGDGMTINLEEYDQDTTNIDIITDGYVDKYTNYQGKTSSGSNTKGSRSGEILREGSIDELLNVLEKLPSSFADEVNKQLQKHFIFDYDGVEKQLY